MPFGTLKKKSAKGVDLKTISKYRFRSLQKFHANFYTLPLSHITSELRLLECYSEWDFTEFGGEGDEKGKWNKFFSVFEEKMANSLGFLQDDMWQGFLKTAFKYYPEAAFNVALECDVRGRRVQDFVSRGLTKGDISLPCNFKHVEGSGRGGAGSASLSSRIPINASVETEEEMDVVENCYDSIRRSSTGSLHASPEPPSDTGEPFRPRSATMQMTHLNTAGPPPAPPFIGQGAGTKSRPAPPPPPGRVAQPPGLPGIGPTVEDEKDLPPAPPSPTYALPDVPFPEILPPPEDLYAEVVKPKKEGSAGRVVDAGSQSSFTATLLLPPGVTQMGGSPLPSPPPSPSPLRKNASPRTSSPTLGREKTRFPNSPLPSPPMPRRSSPPGGIPEDCVDDRPSSLQYFPPPPTNFMEGFYSNFEDAQFMDQVDQVCLVSQNEGGVMEEENARASVSLFLPPPPPPEEL